MTAREPDAVLVADRVEVSFPRISPAPVVRDVSLVLDAGQVTVLLGESGSGKTVLSRSLCALAPAGARVGGSIRFGELELTTASDRGLRRIRGSAVGFIAQDPTSSLDPMRRVGGQLAETLRTHRRGLNRPEVRAEVIRLLDLVQIREPDRVARCYPHELSGGMRQRVAIAIALSSQPRFVVADEPSSALDASVGARVVDLIDDLRLRMDTAVLFITHDVGIARRISRRPGDRVAVMLSGQVVEYGPAATVLSQPRHEYTRALLASDPRPGVPRGSLTVVPDELRQQADWSDLVEVAPGHLVAHRLDFVGVPA